MTAGMLSVIIVVCIGILILSGWCSILFQGISPITVITMLLLWMLCAGRDLLINSLHIDIAWAIWVIIAFICLCLGERRKQHVASYAMMFGYIFLLAVSWLFVEVGRGSGLDLVPTITPWVAAFGLGLIVGVMYDSLIDQWSVITLSYAVGEVLLQWRVTEPPVMQIGSMTLFDAWWISFAAVRMYSAFSVYIVRYSRPRVDNH